MWNLHGRNYRNRTVIRSLSMHIRYIVINAYSERRFAIFQNCIHCFCLKCIRNWRSSNETARIEKESIKSCPICRTISHFIIPSQYWIEAESEKQELIQNYKNNLAQKDCRTRMFYNMF